MGGMQFRGSTCREGHGGTTAVSIGRDDCRISGGVMGLLQGDLPPVLLFPRLGIPDQTPDWQSADATFLIADLQRHAKYVRPVPY
jgi:hypothetical protein